ncbi:MAG: hypothetical protein HC913_14890 [Microscillaceae bacterium]|nr:hypothetical protein [Microscillaceae bacterium]
MKYSKCFPLLFCLLALGFGSFVSSARAQSVDDQAGFLKVKLKPGKSYAEKFDFKFSSAWSDGLESCYSTTYFKEFEGLPIAQFYIVEACCGAEFPLVQIEVELVGVETEILAALSSKYGQPQEMRSSGLVTTYYWSGKKYWMQWIFSKLEYGKSTNRLFIRLAQANKSILKWQPISYSKGWKY